jgi:hypothetical protein
LAVIGEKAVERLRRRIDIVTDERDDARRRCDELSAKLARLHTCGFCGAPAEHGVCAAHADLLDPEVDEE